MSALGPLLRRVEGGRLMFRCPGCDDVHLVRVEGDAPGPRWSWDGNIEAPTFQPSILVTYRDPDGEEPNEVCHSYVREGRIQFLGDCTHALAGRTVPLPAWDRGCTP